MEAQGQLLDELTHETRNANQTRRSDTECRTLKHTVMGVREGDDFASFEKTLPILNEELASLMEWETEESYMYDYQLTQKQISEIERICSIALPHNLTLYLTCSRS